MNDLAQDPNAYQVGGDHYSSEGSAEYQHWDLMWDLYGPVHFFSNISKYVTRFPKKHKEQDLDKALQYTHKLVSLVKKLEQDQQKVEIKFPYVAGVMEYLKKYFQYNLPDYGCETQSRQRAIISSLWTGTSSCHFISIYLMIQDLKKDLYATEHGEPCSNYTNQDKSDVHVKSTTETKDISEIAMMLKFFRKFEDVKIPAYANHGDAGMDVCAHLTEHTSDFPDKSALIIAAGERRVVNTGLHVSVPHGYMIQVCSRSGLAAKNGIVSLISPGIIDSGYRGELKVCLYNSSNDRFVVEHGDRIAQLIVQHVPYLSVHTVEELAHLGDTQRGTGGFGSSGTK